MGDRQLTSEPERTASGRSSRAAWVLVVLLLALLLTAGLWILHLLHAQTRTQPLDATEERVLEQKLELLFDVGRAPDEGASGEAPLAAEIYREDPSRRHLRFSEREINALIARDPALAGRAAVRLSPGQISAGFLVDVPEELPLLGGRRLRVQTGNRLHSHGDRVEARLLGVSVGGIPLPEAWLGGFKGTDLLASSWLGTLGAGIEALTVGDGWVDLRLAE